ncbi:MAG: hypothetical protein JRC92_02120 [Deltaproteobacteria bacterium]|nr:hypothetical protein [Deltaproteobacteria bacterium]
MNKIRYFLGIIDLQTIIVTALALASTFFCRRFNLAAEMPTGLIGVAIIFPIVFSINAAYRRREEALRYFASYKAHALALYYAHRDWVPEGRPDQAERGRGLIQEILAATDRYFTATESEREERFRELYHIFSQTSASHEKLRAAGVPANEVSRANQYLRAMMIELERMRNILLYRTPKSLRAYSWVFLNCFPIFFGPYFAYLAAEYYVSLGYGVAALYSLVLVSLDNIQEGLENPFDQVGADDIDLNVGAQYQPLLED